MENWCTIGIDGIDPIPSKKQNSRYYKKIKNFHIKLNHDIFIFYEYKHMHNDVWIKIVRIYKFKSPETGKPNQLCKIYYRKIKRNSDTKVSICKTETGCVDGWLKKDN